MRCYKNRLYVRRSGGSNHGRARGLRRRNTNLRMKSAANGKWWVLVDYRAVFVRAARIEK